MSISFPGLRGGSASVWNISLCDAFCGNQGTNLREGGEKTRTFFFDLYEAVGEGRDLGWRKADNRKKEGRLPCCLFFQRPVVAKVGKKSYQGGALCTGCWCYLSLWNGFLLGTGMHFQKKRRRCGKDENS